MCEPDTEQAKAERANRLADLDRRVADGRHAVQDLLDSCSVQNDRRHERAGHGAAQASELRSRAADEDDAAGQALGGLGLVQHIQCRDGALGPQIVADGEQAQHGIAAGRYRAPGNLEAAIVRCQQHRRCAAVYANHLDRQRRPQPSANHDQKGNSARATVDVAGKKQHT
jgi:hypothetical protein